ncbi:MAG TPA: transporter [Pyrinomonadaceae bacterium]|jgi:hypothetical protein
MKKIKINLRLFRQLKLNSFFLLSLLLLPAAWLLFSPSVKAQQAGNPSADEDDFIKPTRPGIANPAEIQKSGVLQIEFGYDGNFRAAEFRRQQTAPLNLRFAATSRLLLELAIDAIQSETREESGRRETQTGVGDTRLGIQIVALKEKPKRPALAFAYYVKLPTASEEKELGTGRFDHRVTALVSKKFGKTDLDINASYLNVGREDSSRRADGAQLAVSLSREFENKFGVEAELSGQSLDDVQPKGAFLLGALTYKLNRRLRFDTGMRFGINRDAPRFGVFAGFTVGAIDFYRK